MSNIYCISVYLARVAGDPWTGTQTPISCSTRYRVEHDVGCEIRVAAEQRTFVIGTTSVEGPAPYFSDSVLIGRSVASEAWADATMSTALRLSTVSEFSAEAKSRRREE